jgi:hypothetical protein
MNFGSNDDQLAIIDKRLKYLEESLNRLNKIDWKSLAFTTLISISTTLALDNEKTKMLLTLFKKAFEAILHLLK